MGPWTTVTDEHGDEVMCEICELSPALYEAELYRTEADEYINACGKCHDRKVGTEDYVEA